MNEENQYVILRVGEDPFAVGVSEVKEMLVLPEVTPVPRTPEFMRGIINLRGQVIPLMDLRTRLGRTSSEQEMEELITLMEEREEDHRRWLSELEASVRQNRKFTLPLDHHSCAFGKWYDKFQTDDPQLHEALRAFEEPHKKLHGVAAEVLQLAESGQQDKALTIIEWTRNGVLAKMITLFEDIRKVIRSTHREIALVLERGENFLGLSVDKVESVEELEEGSVADLQRLSGQMDSKLTRAIGRRQDEGREMVLILDTDEMFQAGL